MNRGYLVPFLNIGHFVDQEAGSARLGCQRRRGHASAACRPADTCGAIAAGASPP